MQMGTENQFILFYMIHQRPTDTRCLIPHLEKLAATSLPMPKTIIADAGYGSEENYVYAISLDWIFSFLMDPMYKNRHAKTKRRSKTRKTGSIVSKMMVLFARMEGK
ncbi:hypothetical protein [Anoxybacteroides rupiense]|uniref:hypothetical protein n=1 Tax=Anoxybacteroides rupiense TaxID=311460 RepID=UPI0018446F28|nr:hypothetical protein [Anoxybacillus rupiensis]